MLVYIRDEAVKHPSIEYASIVTPVRCTATIDSGDAQGKPPSNFIQPDIHGSIVSMWSTREAGHAVMHDWVITCQYGSPV